MAALVPKPKICEVGSGGGLFLPLGGDGEQEWPRALRIILYALGLGWLFMGVAAAADIFMGAIETITAKKMRKYDAKKNRWFTVEVWNPTVANLTLMALGSSAPEILLSVIELLSNEFFSGELGPSTIVGSAAFNLLVISAVCIVAIPEGEFRRIKEMPVFFITAFFSVFAYLWLLIILLGTSKNVVEPWEGVVTFLYFPLLVVLAFAADKGYFSREAPSEMGTLKVISADMTKEELAELDTKIRQKYGADLTTEQVSKIALIENSGKKSRAAYRVAATRGITGGKRVKMNDTRSLLERKFTGALGLKLMNQHVRRNSLDGAQKVVPEDEPTAKRKAMIEFAPAAYAILENAGTVTCFVTRSGDMNSSCSVQYSTRDGQAKAVEDYIHKQGFLEFGPGEDRKYIEIQIIDNESYENDEDFFIDLYDCTANSGDPQYEAALGEARTAQITIIDDDLPGVLSFAKEDSAAREDELHVPEQIENWSVDVVVERKHGCTGRIECKWALESSTAQAGVDFEDNSGTIVFENQVKVAKIKIDLKARGRYNRIEDFRLVLTEVTGGAKFDEKTDGGAESDILTIFIETDKEAKDRVDRLMSALCVNWNKAKVGHANWADQFKDALYVNGGDDDGEDEDAGPPGIKDYIMHAITLPWKLLFALVPPTFYCGGWLCFGCSLVMIGLVTAFINDMASLLGCVLTLGNEVTAITFVALGTSLPDTFASMTAATQDAYADASIGNVTGSNSVNVFLGLGLPWMIGAIYWRSGGPNAKWMTDYYGDIEVPSQFWDGAFVVKAGSLGFSVCVFCGCALTCLLTLYIRRFTCAGELGGPTKAKYASAAFLIGLWFLYIGLSSWKSLSAESS